MLVNSSVPLHATFGMPREAPVLLEMREGLRRVHLVGATHMRDGAWSQIDPLPAWESNGTHDNFVAYAWVGGPGQRCIVAVNYAAGHGQCRLRPPYPELAGCSVQFRDLMGPETYERAGSEMLDPGLFIGQEP